MNSDVVINIVLIGILGVIAFLVSVFYWFALTIDKDEKSKHS